MDRPPQWEECLGHFVRRECGIGKIASAVCGKCSLHGDLHLSPRASLTMRMRMVPAS